MLNNVKSKWIIAVAIMQLMILSLAPQISAGDFRLGNEDKLISNVSDTDSRWDNVYQYNKLDKYGEYKIKDSFLGIPTTSVSSTILKDNTESCNSCVASFKIDLEKDTALIDEVRFFDMTGTDIKKKDYKQNYSIKIYDGIETTESYICKDKVCYTEINNQEIWLDYKLGKILPKGTYEIQLSANKDDNIALDWEIKLNGIWTEQWADWGIINGTWNDLRNADTDNWIGTTDIYHLEYDSDDHLIWGSSGSGKFGYFNTSSGVFTNRTETDPLNWMTTSGVEESAFVSNQNGVYTIAAAGKFGFYNKTSGVWVNKSTTDTANWVGTTGGNAIIYNNNSNLIYTAWSSGKFGVYNLTTNVMTDLSATDNGNWVSTNAQTALTYDWKSDLIFTGGNSGSFGYYNKSSNVWTNLTTADPGNWVATSAVNGLDYDHKNNGVWAALAGGKFGFYNKSSGIFMNYTGKDVANWIGGSGVGAVDYDEENDIVWVAVANGGLGYYNVTSDELISLSATDPANWVSTVLQYAIVKSPINNVTYTGGRSGYFGGFNWTDPRPSAVLDSCTYTSGNWDINCSHYCNVTTNIDMGKSNITFYGAGTVKINSTISKVNIARIHSTCNVKVFDGGKFG